MLSQKLVFSGYIFAFILQYCTVNLSISSNAYYDDLPWPEQNPSHCDWTIKYFCYSAVFAQPTHGFLV